MDTFDAAFLLLQEKAATVPFHKCTCVCLKSDKDIQAWGPESRLIGDIVVGAWQRKSEKFLSELRSCYIIEPVLKINNKKINKLFKRYKNIGKDTWKIVEKKVRKLLDATTERSLQYFISQAKGQKKARKADEELDPTITYAAFIAELTGDHIASFMERYPDTILHPEIERLSHYLRVSDEAGPLDKYYVKERLDAIQHKGDAYFEGMTDVEVGKAWTATGVELAYRNNVAEYMIVAQVDSPNKPCFVCRALHGKSFSVVQAKENIDHWLSLKGTEDFAKEAPFPRIADLKNLSREEMHARGELPSFHSHCRCDVVFSWGGEIPVAQRYKPPTPKIKPLDIAKIYAKDFGKQRTKPGTVEDSYLKKLFEKQGYNAKPLVSSKEEIDKLIVTENYKECFRGVVNKKYIEQLKFNDYFAGTGIYGNGTYTAYGKDGEDTAWSYSLHKKENMMKMLIPNDAKTITWDTIKKIKNDRKENPFFKEADILRQKAVSVKTKSTLLNRAKFLENLGKEPGTVATALGYQAIDVPLEKYMVILDRSMLTIQGI